MEEALRNHLMANEPLVALVGERVRWVVSSPDDAGARVVLRVISRQPAYHLAGQTDLADTVVQADCYAESALAALTVARAFKAAIPKAPFTRESIYFSVTQLGERQSYEGDVPSHRVHRVSLDFRVWHSEP
jgi:hypothetical protein